MIDVKLRPPEPSEYTTLDALCFRSKAVWGYDEAFMEACRPALRVDPQAGADGRAMVAQAQGPVLGVAQVSYETGPRLAAELDLLFVDPEAQGLGVGRRLFEWSARAAVDGGARWLGILADPGARPFYERMGARFVRMAPSDVIPGRLIPRMVLDLSGRA